MKNQNKRTVIYGAGKRGAEAFTLLGEGEISKIVFCDKNIEKIGGVHCGREVISINDINVNDEIVLASNSIPSMYHSCLEHQIEENRIKVFDQEKIYQTYKDWCIATHNGPWFNEKLVTYDMKRSAAKNKGISDFLETGNLYNNISVVGIMLSNLCGYACFHKKCPASQIVTKEIMSSEGVKKIINELSETGYSETINFHIYNEPLMDPRLFTFIQYAKQLLPNAQVQIYTNGYYLNQIMVDELIGVGVDVIVITAYSRQEYLRVIELEYNCASEIILGNLDDRLDIFMKAYDDTSDEVMFDRPHCTALLTAVQIYVNGDIGLCCMDYKHPYGLGNVFHNTLQEILNSPQAVDFQRSLLQNKRKYSICKECRWPLGY